MMRVSRKIVKCDPISSPDRVFFPVRNNQPRAGISIVTSRSPMARHDIATRRTRREAAIGILFAGIDRNEFNKEFVGALVLAAVILIALCGVGYVFFRLFAPFGSLSRAMEGAMVGHTPTNSANSPAPSPSRRARSSLSSASSTRSRPRPIGSPSMPASKRRVRVNSQRQQSAALREIETAVEQFNRTTQQNAAMAEQSCAA